MATKLSSSSIRERFLQRYWISKCLISSCPVPWRQGSWRQGSWRLVSWRLVHAAAVAALLCVCTAAGLARQAQGQSHPTPDVASGDWELTLKHEAPRVVVIDGQWKWVMPYTVTNNSRLTVNYWPVCMVQGDNGQLIRSPQVVSAKVFDAVSKAIGGKELVSPTKVAGPIRQGKDFARRSFFIWDHFEQDVDSFWVFVQGLSGETQSFTHPETGEPVRVYRNLMLSFAVPGTPKNPNNVRVAETGKTTVMR